MTDRSTAASKDPANERFFLALFLVGGVHHNVVLGNFHPTEYLEEEIRRGMSRIIHMGHSEITESQFDMIRNAYHNTDAPLHIIVEDRRAKVRNTR
tara:strand:+ start:2308 stop:2595 length:288 start_codon:yes stop_codon:yes gene_type:complete